MKMSEYAAKHANDGKKIDVKTMVAAATLVGETIEIKEIVFIEKTAYDNQAYLIRISDDTGFFTTASLTRQINKFVSDGVGLNDLTGERFLVEKRHMDASEGKRECDFLQFVWVPAEE